MWHISLITWHNKGQLILRHPSHALYAQFLLGILQWNPENRFSANDCLQHAFCTKEIDSEVFVVKDKTPIVYLENSQNQSFI